MNTYVILLRGINVGGKNKIPMADLRTCLESHGFQNVTSYLQSGNVILQSDLSALKTAEKIEKILPSEFKLDSSIVRILALTHDQLRSIVETRPKGFGDEPDTYHSDVVFLMGFDMKEAISVFDPREGVDKIWEGEGVIYSQRLSSKRTKSRLSKIVGTVAYKSMTIRNWNTTTKLLHALDEMAKTTQ